MLPVRAVVFASLILGVPLGAKAADLVIWWHKGFSAQEDEAAAEIVAAFEQQTGKQVELDLLTVDDIDARVLPAIAAGQPPDFLFALVSTYYAQWAYEDRLVELSNEILPFASLFDRDALAAATLLNATTGRRALYALPMGINTNHVHVWRTLLEQAEFTLDDIPKQWEAFWSFWCDQVQPAVRRATGRDDLWGVGLPMSAKANDTFIQFDQFIQAYQANYVTREGKLVIDDPEIRRRLIKSMNSYAGIYLKGCSPPDSIDWTTIGNNNNKQFLTQRVVMLPNDTLSVPTAFKSERPEDYNENTATVSWPDGADGEPLAIRTYFLSAVAFKARGHVPLAKELVRFLVGEGWLAHYLNFSGERMLPAMPKLLDQPFWLDPSDRHHMASAIQFLTRPRAHNYAVASGNPRHLVVDGERVWANAIHRVAAEGISPEQAVDAAIARIKQILSE